MNPTVTVTDIAKATGKSRSNVVNHAKRLGVGHKRDAADQIRFTEEERDKIIISMATTRAGRPEGSTHAKK